MTRARRHYRMMMWIYLANVFWFALLSADQFREGKSDNGMFFTVLALMSVGFCYSWRFRAAKAA